MSDLADLDLVAQAMAPTMRPSRDARQSDPPSPAVPPSTQPRQNGNADHAPTRPRPAADPARPDAISSLDLSSLSPSELAMLQPLLDSLRISDPAARSTPPRNGEANGDGAMGGEDESGNGDELEIEDDELRIAEILAQMDAAGEVADELEGKLDRLIEMLGKEEEAMGLDRVDGKEVKNDGPDAEEKTKGRDGGPGSEGGRRGGS